jgi:hypothetical protein
MKTKLKVVAVALMTGVALGSLTGLSSCQRQQESALKPIDQVALQTVVDTTAKELLIPGAVVLLRTLQGEFTVSYGTTPHRWGWKVFEAPGVEPVFPEKRQSSALKTESRSVLAGISHRSSVMTIKG